jgi:two-component system OmpR family sensor kinase
VIDALSGYSLPGAVYLERRDDDGDVLGTSRAVEGTATDRPQLPDPLPVPATAGPDASGQVANVTFVAPSALPDHPGFVVRVIRASGNGGVIVAGLSLVDEDQTLARLVVVELIVSAVVLVVGAAVGWRLVRVGLRPLDDIEHTASEIAGGDLTRRVANSDPNTEVGRLGASLNEMLHQIETAFAQRTASEDALRRSEGRLRTFVADASHELRTPVAAVQAYAELLETAAQEHPEDLSRITRNVRGETQRMGVLVDDLLLLTRLDQGLPLVHQQVDLGALADEAVDAAKAVDPDRPIELRVHGLVEVEGDRVRLRQVLDNVMTNIRMHTPPGVPAEIEVDVVDGRARVRVVEHGPGLDTEDANRAFERFYRADAGRARSDGGSGLGLSIVRAICAAHGGEAAIERTPGGGTTIVITLPLLVDHDAPPVTMHS